MASSPGVSSLTRVEAVFTNKAIYELAELIPKNNRLGGRKREYPDFMMFAFDALISVYGSARKAEAEMAHRHVWKFIRRLVKNQFPDDTRLHLPPGPYKRY